MVGRKCAFSNCTIRESKKKWPYIRFFKLPNKKHFPKWREDVIDILCQTREPSSINFESANICSRHYNEECFYCAFDGAKKLKPGSLPTRNLPIGTTVPQIHPQHIIPDQMRNYDLQNLRHWIIDSETDRTVELHKTDANGQTLYLSVINDMKCILSIDGFKTALTTTDFSKVRLENFIAESIDPYNICSGYPRSLFGDDTPLNAFEKSTCVRSKICDVVTADDVCGSCVNMLDEFQTKQASVTSDDVSEKQSPVTDGTFENELQVVVEMSDVDKGNHLAKDSVLSEDNKPDFESQGIVNKAICGICDKVFGHASYLKRHLMRKHSIEKPHHCETCQKSFSFAGDLKRHLMTHVGEKPYRCGTCHKTFTQANSLQRHYVTHTGDKPFICGQCDKGFSQLGHVRRHMKRVHCQEALL